MEREYIHPCLPIWAQTISPITELLVHCPLWRSSQLSRGLWYQSGFIGPIMVQTLLWYIGHHYGTLVPGMQLSHRDTMPRRPYVKFTEV